MGITEEFHTIADCIATGCLLAGLARWFWSHERYRRFISSGQFWLVPCLLVLALALAIHPPSQVVDWDSALQFGRGIVDRSLDAVSQCGCGGEMPQLEAARVHWCSQLLSLSLAATLFCPQRPSLLVRVPVQCHWGIPRCLGFVSCYRETVPGAAYKSAYTGLRRGS